MSYCRFEGTHAELLSCISDVEEHIEGEAEYPVDDREIDYFRKIVEAVHDFMVDNDLLDGYGDLDHEALEDVCEKMRKGGENGEDHY